MVAVAAHLLPMPDREPVDAYVGLGANLGDARDTFDRAVLAIEALPGTKLMKRSSRYSSAPVDATGPDYSNEVAAFSTTLPAPLFLNELLRIEADLGRTRPFFHAPRTIDLDLLLFGNSTITSPRLTVPHPRMWERAFVLVPLAEVAPERVTSAQLAVVRGQVITKSAG